MRSCQRPYRLCLWLLLAVLSACTGSGTTAERATSAPPPVGHFEGTLPGDGPTAVRVALDIRHPRPGHYQAELTGPAPGTLSFVADTLYFAQDSLRLVRPGLAGQVLRLKHVGEFWRGTLTLDSASAPRPLVLVKRGPPVPRTYAVEELPRPTGSAWLYGPADHSTRGAALLLLPDLATAHAAPRWADALARAGIIVLTLPALDTASVAGEADRLRLALSLLRRTPGADTANVGVWATGPRAVAVAGALAQPAMPAANFLILQNAVPLPVDRPAFRALAAAKTPVLGLYGGSGAKAAARQLRTALGGRRGPTVLTYPDAGPDLLQPGMAGPRFGPGLPGAVEEWLQGK